MKYIKILIVFFMIVSIISLSMLLFLTIQQRNTSNKESEMKVDINRSDAGEVKEISDELVNVDTFSKANLINTCLEKYYKCMNNQVEQYNQSDINGTTVSQENIDEIRYSFLSNEYIKKHEITINNIREKIKNYNSNLKVVCLDMKVQINYPVEKYIVYGILINDQNRIEDKFYTYVNIDLKNKAFSIEPIDSEYKGLDNIKTHNENEIIVANKYNTFFYAVANYESAIQYYLEKFQLLMLSDIDLSFEYIDESYKEKKMRTIEEYKKYINKNGNRILKSNITKYLTKYTENRINFICVDQNNYYYIFKQENGNPWKFSVMLDNYTIDPPEFIEKYNNGSVQQKVGMNIEKIISAMNCKDYDYIYNKLDEKYKENNFPTIDRLEEVLKNNAFDINIANYNSFKENGNDIYTYNITIKAMDSEGTKPMTIVMKLLEDRNFVFSFSFN